MESKVVCPFLQLLIIIIMSVSSSVQVCGFTIIVPDSPSELVDNPQEGLQPSKDDAYTDPEEQRAVYRVMSATGNGWATTIPDVCKGRWHGIECMPDQQGVLHVVSLSFGALSDDTAFPTCSPNSYISSAVAGLPHLKKLFFYQCCNSNPRPIPKELGKLANSLESLVLRENGHVGSIPIELGKLFKLQTLDLHGNSLSAAIPATFSDLKDLQLLDLSNNKLKGRLPGFAQLERISILDLHQNLLSGPIPESIGLLESLAKLDLSRNRLSGPIPESFGNLQNLILLDLGHNVLSGPIPESLGELKQLHALILQDNSIGGAIPQSLGNLEGLTTLVMSGAGLEGSIPESVGKLKRLRVLCLDANRLNGSIPGGLSSLAHISELKVNGNLLSGPLPFHREFFWTLGRKLQVSDNPGLCYQPSSPAEEMESPFPLGIRHCEQYRTSRHFSDEAFPPIPDQIRSFPLMATYESSSPGILRRWPRWILIIVLTVLEFELT